MQTKTRITQIVSVLGILWAAVVSGQSWNLNRDTLEPEHQDAVLSITEAARYAIMVDSEAGASLTLVDPVTGPGETSGQPGETNGRIDCFLDPGDYLLKVQRDERDTQPVHIHIRTFIDQSSRTSELPGLDIASDSLNDLQIKHAWFTMETPGEIWIEAAGRALQEMRIWLNGTFLTGDIPVKKVVSGTPGQPLNVMRLKARCPAGTHRLSLYGGQPLKWSVNANQNPLYLRSGLAVKEAAGEMSGTLSVFGEDFFILTGGTNTVRLDSPVLNTGLDARDYNHSPDTAWDPSDTMKITDKNVPFVEKRLYGGFDEKIIKISGTPGTPYRLVWFKKLDSRRQRFSLKDPSDLTLVQSGNPLDTPPLSAFIIEEPAAKREPSRMIAHSALQLDSQTSVTYKFNVSKPIFLFMEFQDPGDYHFDAGAFPGRFILEPFLLSIPADYVEPLPAAFPGQVNVTSQIYGMTILPDKPGTMQLTVRHDSLPENSSQPLLMTNPCKLTFNNLNFKESCKYRFLMNETGSNQGYSIVKLSEKNRIFQPRLVSAPLNHKDARVKPMEFVTVHPGTPVTVNLPANSSRRLSLNVDQPGAWQVETNGLLHVNADLRSLMRIGLNGLNNTINGHNRQLRQFLTPGQYFLELTAANDHYGPVTVTLSPLDSEYFGTMGLGDLCRTDATQSSLTMIDLIIPDEISVRIDAETRNETVMLRLEDDRGWPVKIARNAIDDLMLPGETFKLYQLASPGVSAIRTSLTTTDDPEPVKGPGPHTLDLIHGGYGLWENGPDHQWLFTLTADTVVSLSLSAGMTGTITTLEQTANEPVALPANTLVKHAFNAGKYRLTVHSELQDTLKPYRITGMADPMVSGFKTTMKKGETVTIIPGIAAADSAVVINCQSRDDIRGSLSRFEDDRWIETVALDDIPGDWTPCFVEFPGLWHNPATTQLQLTLSSVTGTQHTADVSVIVPDVQPVIIKDEKPVSVESMGKLLKIEPETMQQNDTWIVSITSRSLLAVSGADKPACEHVQVISPNAGSTAVSVWEIDQRNAPVTVKAIKTTVTNNSERSDTTPLKWTDGILGDHRVSIAQFTPASPGYFQLQTSGATIPAAVGRIGNCPWQTAAVYIDEPVIFYRVDSSAEPVKIARITLSPLQRTATVYGAGELRLDLSAGHWGVVQFTATSTHGQYHGTLCRSPRVSPTVNFSEINGLPRETDTIMDLQLTAIPETDLETLSSEIGQKWMEPGTMVRIKPGSGTCELYLDDTLVSVDEAGDTLVFNTTESRRGLAWHTPMGTAVALPAIVAKHGPSIPVFVGAGMTQPYQITVTEAQSVGISVSCSGGDVIAVLTGPGESGVTTREILHTGLVMNPWLEPGTYVLEVSVPPGGLPSSVQPFFVIETPESLRLFGRKE